jgi:hypothetical protein
MSSLEQRLATVTNRATHLNLQLSKLNGLRDRVRQAELSARESRRMGNRKVSDGTNPRPSWSLRSEPAVGAKRVSVTPEARAQARDR